MAQAKIYMTPSCPYCSRALRLLERRGATYDKIDVRRDPALRAEMERLTGRHTVPQIFIGERHVGGYDDLVALDMDGVLETLLAAS